MVFLVVVNARRKVPLDRQQHTVERDRKGTRAPGKNPDNVPRFYLALKDPPGVILKTNVRSNLTAFAKVKLSFEVIGASFAITTHTGFSFCLFGR